MFPDRDFLWWGKNKNPLDSGERRGLNAELLALASLNFSAAQFLG